MRSDVPRRRSRYALPSLLALLLAVSACSDQSEIGPGRVEAVRVDPETLAVVLTRTDTLKAFPIDERGSFLPNKQVSWSSDAPGIVSVNEAGEVTGLMVGMATITASVGRVSGTAVVNVVPAPTIGASSTAIQFTAIGSSGVNPTDTVLITNTGGSVLDALAVGTITYSAGATDWLTAGLDQSTAPANLELIASVTGLPLGTYTATVPVTDPDATNTPLDLTVTLTVSAGTASNVAVSAGDNQNATAGSAVATAPAVLVTDQFGNPVAGVAVTFAVASGGGSVTGAAAVTGADGVAAVGSWTLGTATGANTLTATAPGLTGSPVTFTANATAGTASQLTVSAGNGQTAVAGQPVATAPAVLVRDQFNNPVPNAAVTFAVATGGGSVTGAAATTNPSGIATLGSWTLGTTAGSNTLTATVTGLAPITFTATGVAGAAATLTAQAGNNQSAPVATAVAVAPAVRISDQNGNPVAGVAVTFAVASGGGSATGTSTTTNAGGLATLGSWTLGTTAGANTLTASSSGLTPVTFTATGTAGAPASIAIQAGDGQSAAAGSAVATPPAVRVTDANANPVGGANVSFAVTAGGGSVTGGSATTDALGIATVGSWTLGPAVGTGNNGLQATVSGLGSSVSFTASATAAAATTLALNAGDAQVATVGTAVGINPAVLVTDQFGNPVGGVAVTFAVTGGGGSVTAGSATTNALGIATVGSWTLGPVAGSNTLSATSTGLTGSPGTFTATGTAAAASQIAVNAGNGQSAPAGGTVAVPPSVLITDQFGNPVSGVAVTFAVASGGGSATGTNQVTSASGIATVGSWTLGANAGTNTLSATSAGLTGSPVTFSATGTAGAATTLAKSAGDNQAATAGTAVATAPRVLVTDLGGNPVQGVAVTFAVTAGGGSVTGGSATTDAQGLATVGSWILGTVAGTGNNSLQATASGLTAVTFTASATAGAAASVTITAGDGQSATVGTAVAIDPAVTVTDQFGNPVSGVAVAFAVASGGGSVTGAAATSSAGGLATVGSWTLGTAVGGNTLTATVAGLTPATFSATATAGAAASVATNAGDGQSAPAGTAVAVAPSVVVRDQFNNPVAGVGVTFAVATGGGSATGTNATTSASGIATVGSWTLGAAVGPNTLTATVGGLTPVTFTASGTSGSASSIALNAGDGQTATVGSAVATPPSVIVRDALNNPVSGVNVSFAVAGGGGSLTGGSATTNASGIATVGSWTLGTTAGSNTLTATSAGLTGSPITFTATGTAAAATTIAVSAGNGQSATVGTAVAAEPAVLVSDQFGNPAAGVAVTFAVATGGGSATGTAATTNASGIATVGSWTLGTTAGSNTLTATSAGLTGSPVTFTATGTPGAATQIAVSAGDGQSATAGTAVAVAPAVVVRDQFNNPVAGASVTFAVATGGGSATGTGATTSASGIATVGSWTLGTTAGGNTLTATTGALTPITFTATGTAGAPALLVKSAGDNQATAVNTAVPVAPAVTVTDANGNQVGAGISVAFAVTAGGGSVAGTPATTNASGVATLGSWTLGGTAGANNNTLSASVPALPAIPAVTFTATANSGSATTLAQGAGNGQTGTVGTTLGTALTATVTDGGGNPVAGFGVSWAAAGGGSVNCGSGPVPNCTATTNGSGVSSATWTLGPTAGAQTATASAGGLSGSPVTYNATATAGAAATIALNSGDGQSATVGTAVTTAPSVLVTDAFGNPRSGVAVTFAVATGGGSVTGGNATSNASGIATVGSWTLGQAAGSNTLTATSAGLGGSPVTFTATGTAGAPASIAINAGNAQSATVGSAVAVDPSVVVRDAFNNLVSGASVSFAVATGGGSVTGSPALTNASGIATVGSWTLGNVAGANSLTATVAALTPVTFTATGTAAGAATIALNAGNGQSATVNTAVATDPSVLVTDQFGNPVAGVGVTFAAATGGGSVTGGSATTSSSGIATVGSWTLGTTAGANTLTATSAGLTGSPVTFSATGLAGAATQITLSAGNGQSAPAGSPLAVAPSVLVRDQFNNPVSGVAVTFAVTAGGGGLTGANATSDASGIATVGSWTLGPTAGTSNNTLTATSAGLTGSPVTFTASATAAAAATVAINAGNAQSATVGTAVPIDPSVIITDQFGNPVSGATVTFAIGLGGGAVQGGTQLTSAGGIATVGSWTLGSLAGSNTLTATVGALTPATFTATGTAGAATQISVNAGNGQSSTVGTPVSIDPSVLVSDQFGNPVSGAAVTFAVQSGGGSVTGGSQSTNASGIATVTSWTLGTTAGGNSLNATTGALTPATFTATGTAGPAAAAQTTAAVPAGTAGSLTTITVTSRDQFGNLRTTGGASVVVTVSGANSASPAVTDNGNGTYTASYTPSTAGSDNVAITLGGAAIGGSPYTSVVSPGAAAAIAVNAGNNQSAQVGTAVTVAPSVLVTDGLGNPVSGVAVTFAVSGGGGNGSGLNQTTNASGVATVGSWTLGTTAGANTLSATSAGLAGSPVTFTATGTAGPAATIAKSAGDGQTATVNTAVATDPAVLVSDAFGNPVSGVSVTFAVTSGGGAGTGLNQTTNAAGIATVTSWTLGTIAGGNSMSATASVGSVTFNATGTAGTPTQIAINAGNGQTATVNTAVATDPSVVLRDQFNNLVGGATVTFAVTAGGGSVAGGTAISNASGIAAVTSWTVGTAAGSNNNTLQATSATAGSVNFTASASAGAATQIAVNAGNGQTATVNTAVTVDPSVLVRDAFNNPVGGVAVTFSVFAGGGSVTGASQTTNAGGIATVTSWTLGTTAGSSNNTLRATSTGLTGSPVSFTASANAGAAANIALVAGNSQAGTVNTTLPIDPSVRITDAFGNNVSGTVVTWNHTSASGTINCTGVSTTTSCTVTSGATGLSTLISQVLGTVAGANTVTATASGLTGSPITFSSTGTAGAVTTLTRNSTNNQTARPDNTVTSDPSVIATDAFGNVVSGATVTFTVTNATAPGEIVCVLFATTSCSETTNASGVATIASWRLSANGTAPTVGSPSGGTYANTLSVTSGTGSTTFSATARWSFASDVAPKFTTNTQGSCDGCHSVGNFGVYANTVNRATVDNPGCGTIVVPGSLASSVLYQKINFTPPCGVSMPQGGSPLSQTERFIIRDWILNSAPNN